MSLLRGKPIPLHSFFVVFGNAFTIAIHRGKVEQVEDRGVNPASEISQKWASPSILLIQVLVYSIKPPPIAFRFI
jgi:hypothetical protein